MTKNASIHQAATPSTWYVAAMEQLVNVVQELSHARTLDTIMAIVRTAARSLTRADGATFVLRDGDQCFYADEDAISPLWKGQRFPMKICISGWVMLHAEPAIIEDIYKDPRIPADAYRPTFVKSLAMVPIRRTGPIGAIGNYWASTHSPTKEEVAILQALADTTSVAIENAYLYAELQLKMQMLEKREERIRAQHETLEVFTRALAHDLKEPMRTIGAFTDMITEAKAAPEIVGKYFGYIQKAATRMSMLIDTVFLYMQLDDPTRMKKTPCDMNKIIQEVQENLTHLISKHHAVITCDLLPEVNANPMQMLQLLQNLISNAIHHNPSDVTIHIKASEREEEWLFSVQDNGQGIPPHHCDNIFSPFKRLDNKEECSGLGLATCKKILEFNQGSIWCESVEGNGATFLFTLPKHPKQPKAKASPTSSMVATSSSHNTNELANVLLVDDRDADIALTQAVLLRSAGMQCNLMIAQSAKDALTLLKEETAKGRHTDLMLLDINMPEMDGFELLEHMQNDTIMKQVAVIMCSGSTYEKDQQRAKSLGAIGYVVKPPMLEKLKPSLALLSTVRLCKDENEGYRLVRIKE